MRFRTNKGRSYSCLLSAEPGGLTNGSKHVSRTLIPASFKIVYLLTPTSSAAGPSSERWESGGLKGPRLKFFAWDFCGIN